jgi:hypothetical protein
VATATTIVPQKWTRLKEGVLVTWAICRSGHEVLLHIELGNRESYTAWMDLIRDMIKRGLNTPVLITPNGAPELIRAVVEARPKILASDVLLIKCGTWLTKCPKTLVRK